MTGLVLATKAEAQSLLDLLDARKLADEPFETWWFKSAAGRTGGIIVISGMGGEHAAAATEHLITHRGATTVINVGICGGVGDGVEAGNLYRITEALDGDALLADGPPQPQACGGDCWQSLPPARVASVTTPVFDDAHRVSLNSHVDLVDMEGWAVADTCRRHGIRCYLLKGVSDMADRAGKFDIRKNIDAVSARLAEVTIAQLGHLPKGPKGIAAAVMSFTKIEHVLFSLPLLFAGAWLGAGHLDGLGAGGRWPSLRIFALVALAGVGARALGMAMNRILDRNLDMLNRRTAGRELPSGRMGLWGAAGVAAGGLAVYLLACWMLPPLCLMLSPLPIVVLAGYSLLKRFTNLCHFGIGLCLALAPLGAYTAASGRLPLGWDIFLLAMFAFCWISGADIVYGLDDIDSDRETGIHSIPVSLGPVGAQFVAAGVHAVAIGAIAVLWFLVDGGVLSGIALAVSVAAFAAGYLQRIPVRARFFPIFVVAGIAGALVPLLSELG